MSRKIRIVDWFPKDRRRAVLKEYFLNDGRFEYLPDEGNCPDKSDYFFLDSSYYYKDKIPWPFLTCKLADKIVLMDYAFEMEKADKHPDGMKADFVAIARDKIKSKGVTPIPYSLPDMDTYYSEGRIIVIDPKIVIISCAPDKLKESKSLVGSIPKEAEIVWKMKSKHLESYEKVKRILKGRNCTIITPWWKDYNDETPLLAKEVYRPSEFYSVGRHSVANFEMANMGVKSYVWEKGKRREIKPLMPPEKFGYTKRLANFLYEDFTTNRQA